MEGNRYPAHWIILFPVKLNCVDTSKRTAGCVEALDKLLYLADGEERQPLGWSELTLTVQTQTVTFTLCHPAADSLAFPAVVDLISSAYPAYS